MANGEATVEVVYAGEAEHHDGTANLAFGFWIYLMTDLILFASLFATFAVLSHSYAGGPSGKELFDLPYTFAETLFLLFSSATYGLVMIALRQNKKAWVMAGLMITFLLGLGFILMEIHEFHAMVFDGNGPSRSSFLSAFFTLVGTHGTHVTFGLIWMAVMVWQVFVKGLTTPVQSRLLRLSMFWHFLDIVWIGVFTVVYLLGVM
ncbi:MAG: cytochrome o ubiquinol oxidase subunit III [Thioalkalispiraceae bacterium]|jgi:cytochrome o ubiquinol oxidase subunit 3